MARSSQSPTIPFLLEQLSVAAANRDTEIASEIAQLETERTTLAPFLNGQAAASLSGNGVAVVQRGPGRPRKGPVASNIPDKIVALLAKTQGWMKFSDIQQRIGFSSVAQGRYFMKRLRNAGRIKMRGRTAATEYSIV